MKGLDFWDFMLEGGYDLLFPDEEDDTVECDNCGRVIKGSEEDHFKQCKITDCRQRL